VCLCVCAFLQTELERCRFCVTFELVVFNNFFIFTLFDIILYFLFTINYKGIQCNIKGVV